MTNHILQHYPELRGKPRAMAMFCSLFRDRGMPAEALALGEAALEAAPCNLSVRHEVQAALSRGVAAFHGPILLDRARNAAYARAIEAAVRPGMLVLEIGTGSGLLAMLAARAGAQVVTCEANPLVATAAQRIVERNGLADKVTVVAKPSSRLEIGEDLQRPADLVIHEIFGSQLYEEGVVAALADARRRLLAPGAPSLPHAAALRCALVASDQAPHATLADVHGFDLSVFELLVRPVRFVRLDTRRGLTLRSAPASVLPSDFDAPLPAGVVAETVPLRSTGGDIHGIVQWIEIAFADGSRLENDPFSDGPQSSWAACFTPFAAPMPTRSGEIVALTARRRDALVTLDAAKRPAA